MDICWELASVPHHQRFLVVVYDLHSKWPEVVPMGSVKASAIVDFLEQLFSRWGMPRAIAVHGLCRVCDQCNQLSVLAVQWMMGIGTTVGVVQDSMC